MRLRVSRMLAPAIAAVIATTGCDAPAPTSSTVLAGASAPAIERPANPAGGDLLAPSRIPALLARRIDRHYGFYAGDRKIGFARLQLRPTVAGEPGGFATRLEMHVEASAGQGARRTTRDRRYFYAAEPPYRLLEARFVDRTPEGASERVYRASRERVEVTAYVDGVARARRTLPPTAETVISPLLQLAFAPSCDTRVGQQAITYDLDEDESGRDERTTVTVTSVETRAGEAGAGETRTVETRTGSRVAALAIQRAGEARVTRVITSEDGTLLRATVGDDLQLRLESPAQARAGIRGLAVADDGVPLAGSIFQLVGEPRTLDTLTLLVDTGPLALPDGPQQRVWRRTDGRYLVELRSVPGPEVTAAERTAALAATSRIDADAPGIVDRAAALTAGASSDTERVARLARFVHDHLDKQLATSLPVASQVLARGTGDCTEHTLLFVALARAAGIPAREVSGLVYMGDGVRRFGWHAWPEVALDGRWVAVDPTWGEERASAAHLALGVAGDRDWVAVMSRIGIELVDVRRSVPQPRGRR